MENSKDQRVCLVSQPGAEAHHSKGRLNCHQAIQVASEQEVMFAHSAPPMKLVLSKSKVVVLVVVCGRFDWSCVSTQVVKYCHLSPLGSLCVSSSLCRVERTYLCTLPLGVKPAREFHCCCWQGSQHHLYLFLLSRGFLLSPRGMLSLGEAKQDFEES